MAAYNLQVQKPSSLAVPNGPGAADLARFLSVSETNRSNKNRENLNEELFEWDKGAGDRQRQAETAERQRAKDETEQLGYLLNSGTKNYLKQQADEFKFHDDAKAQLRTQYPDMTDEQLEQLVAQKRQDVVSDPNLYADPRQMTESLKNHLMTAGYGQESWQDMVDPRVQSNFAPPSAPMNENILNGFIDVIKEGGLTDNVKDMELVQGPNGEPMVRFNGGSSGSDNGNLSQDEYRESSQYVQEIINDPNNEFRSGRRSWFTRNLPWTRDEAYRDDLENMFVLGETSEGVQPQYVAGIVQSMTSEGQLPRGVKAADLKNPESDFYQTVMDKARELQNRDMGVAGSGSAGGGSSQNAIPLSALRELQQADLGMQTQALSDLLGMAGGARRGPLTPQEQFELLNDEEMLREFGLIMQQTQNGQGNPQPVQNGNNQGAGNTVVSEVPENPAPQPDAAQDPLIQSLLQAESGRGQNTPTQPVTRDDLVEELARLDQQEAGNRTIPQNRSAIRGNPTVTQNSEERDALVQQLAQVEAQQRETERQNRAVSLETMTDEQLAQAIPDEFEREQAQTLLEIVRGGSASQSQIRALTQLLERGSR